MYIIVTCENGKPIYTITKSRPKVWQFNKGKTLYSVILASGDKIIHEWFTTSETDAEEAFFELIEDNSYTMQEDTMFSVFKKENRTYRAELKQIS